jgi:hypothetical protein
MLQTKRLKNLKLLKEKSLNKVTKEINTLNNEVKKSNNLADKLKIIKQNSKLDNKINNSMSIMYKYQFDHKLIEQISICENRAVFLEKELARARNKLGNIISQKKIIEDKIKIAIIKKNQKIEEKITRDTPSFRKG